MTPTEKIWHNGRFILWEEATIHVLSHVVNYGSSVFEGIRCYSTPSGPAVFRLREHIRRMLDSAKVYRMDNLGFSAAQLAEAMLELVRVNNMDACYLRPIVVRDGKIHTPPLGASVLPGITRDSILTLARELGIPAVETIIPREMLYIADEVFFSGTAAEITPIRSVDRITIGSGHRGPIAERLQREFFGIVEGRTADRFGWLTAVAQPVAAR